MRWESWLWVPPRALSSRVSLGRSTTFGNDAQASSWLIGVQTSQSAFRRQSMTLLWGALVDHDIVSKTEMSMRRQRMRLIHEITIPTFSIQQWSWLLLLTSELLLCPLVLSLLSPGLDILHQHLVFQLGDLSLFFLSSKSLYLFWKHLNLFLEVHLVLLLVLHAFLCFLDSHQTLRHLLLEFCETILLPSFHLLRFLFHQLWSYWFYFIFSWLMERQVGPRVFGVWIAVDFLAERVQRRHLSSWSKPSMRWLSPHQLLMSEMMICVSFRWWVNKWLYLVHLLPIPRWSPHIPIIPPRPWLGPGLGMSDSFSTLWRLPSFGYALLLLLVERALVGSHLVGRNALRRELVGPTLL